MSDERDLKDAAPKNPSSSSEPSTERGRKRRGLIDWFEQRLNLSELFSFVSHFGFVYTRVDTQGPVREVVRQVAEQRVPVYATWPRVLGLLAAILLGLQIVTGVLLAYYYRPTPEAAFESVRTIVRDLPFGWFLHQIHSWGSKLLIVVVVLRLLRLFWDELYRSPRELLWWSAVGLTWLVLQSDFTGRLLIWNTDVYWSTVRGLEVVFALPLVGPVLSFLLGGQVVNEDVLIRFYVLHLLVLPLAAGTFVYLTFATLRRVGLSPEGEEQATRTSSFREHIFSMLILWVLMFGLLVTLATLVPFQFFPVADPYATPSGVEPPWYMLAPYALLQGGVGPEWLRGLVLVGAAVAVFLLPLWFRGQSTPRRRLGIRIVGVVVIAIWIALSAAGAIMERS